LRPGSPDDEQAWLVPFHVQRIAHLGRRPRRAHDVFGLLQRRNITQVLAGRDLPEVLREEAGREFRQYGAIFELYRSAVLQVDEPHAIQRRAPWHIQRARLIRIGRPFREIQHVRGVSMPPGLDLGRNAADLQQVGGGFRVGNESPQPGNTADPTSSFSDGTRSCGFRRPVEICRTIISFSSW